MQHSTRLPCSSGRAAPSRVGLRPARLSVTAAIKEKSGREIICSKTLTAQKGKEGQVSQLCKQLEDAGLAAAKDRSAGVLQFGVLQDQFEGNTFHIYERYTDNVSMGRFNTRPEVADFMKEVQPLLEGPVGMALYECRNGKIGNVCVQGGPKGEGGLDDVSGASGAAAGASLKQTSALAIGLDEGHDDHGKEQQAESGDTVGQLKKQVDEFAKKFSAFTDMFARK